MKKQYIFKMDICNGFNKEMINLINEGYMFIPHEYTNGELHEIFFKDDTIKILKLEKKYHYIDTYDGYAITITTTKITDKDKLKYCKSNIFKYTRWTEEDEWSTKEIIKSFYCLDYNDAIYTESKEEYNLSKVKRNKRNFKNDKKVHLLTSLESKIYAHEYVKKQPRCKSIPLKNVEGIMAHDNYYEIKTNRKNFIIKKKITVTH